MLNCLFSHRKMSVPKSALHGTQIFNVADIKFFGKFGTGVYVGEGGRKKPTGKRAQELILPFSPFSLKHLLTSLTPKPSGVSGGNGEQRGSHGKERRG